MAVYEDLERLYAWIDEIPLSRFKKNLPRDFSDGGKCLIMHFSGYIRYSQPSKVYFNLKSLALLTKQNCIACSIGTE